MGINMKRGGKQNTEKLFDNNQRGWLDLYHLLDEANYDQAADHFEQILATNNENNNPTLEPLLAAAHQLYLLCRQYNDEVSRYQQAHVDAAAREADLRQQLTAVLDQVVQQIRPVVSNGEDTSEIEKSAPDIQIKNSRSLWQRLQQTLWPKKHNPPVENPINDNQIQAPPLTAPHRVEETAVLTINNEPQQGRPPSLAVYCLGPFQVYEDDIPIDEWSNGKGKSIFKYLITHRQHPVNKEVLMDLFWPDANPDAARNNLNVAIYGLRQTLRNDHSDFSHVLFQSDNYLLNPELQVWIDVEEFSNRIRSAQKLIQQGHLGLAIQEYQAAEGLYQGEFLLEDRYEEWLLPHRQNYQDAYLGVLDQLSSYYYDIQDYAACVILCHKMLAIESCREDTHRRLMRSYCRQRQHYLALRQYHQCVEALKKELDVVPDPTTAQLYERIRHRETV